LSRSLIFLVNLLIDSQSAMQLSKIEPRFKYDTHTSKCVDSEGTEGLNPFEPEILFKGITPEARGVRWPTRLAQCIDFSTVKFHEFLGVNYNVLVEWDFRGAIFTEAELTFNFIENGLFIGSNIGAMQIGYGRVTAADRAFDQGDMPMPIAKETTEKTPKSH
jgi:hypothetical protein